MNRVVSWVVQLPSQFLIFGVRLYQIFLSPIFGRFCRFQPTCSNYFIGACRSTVPYAARSRAWRGFAAVIRSIPVASIRRRRRLRHERNLIGRRRRVVRRS